LIRDEKLSENIKMKEEKKTLNEKNENWTNENEENEDDEKKKNEKTSKKKWLEEFRRNRDSTEVFFLN
jgi:Sec-independent protein translocase protein TatA